MPRGQRIAFDYPMMNPPSTTRARTRRRGRYGLSKRQRTIVRDIIKNQKEPNYIDHTISGGTDIVNSGAPEDIFSPPQGDGNGERVGDRISFKSLSLNYTVYSNNTGSVSPVVRIILFKWKPDTANDTPTLATILEGSTYIAPYVGEREARRKFNVVYDKMHICNPAATAGNVHVVNKTIPLKGKVYFNEGLTTGSGKLYLLALSSTSVANTTEWGTGSRFRLRYIEE